MKIPEDNSRRKFIRTGAAFGASMIASRAYGNRRAGENLKSSGMTSISSQEGFRTLGSGQHALKVSPIGLGCMSMTSVSYNAPRSMEEMVPVLREFEKIELIGVRESESVLTDR